ncbi:rhodanese-like domain-containing protein [Tahibacter amnicola]|uniref:Rhodanese-like domain-containing protein n=1 Tax=Tahibacter amnicola TaxID=2976241 RepID=A0ABY6BI75_9GAMM|nr:rhodanese-like domain-containing protein [Tahibacter amnicola]UXI68321.1 rhodanese-like domain-containing protein [Tahibacter amnicola]
MSEFLQHLPVFIQAHPILSMAFVGILFALISLEASRLFRGYKEVTPAQLTQLINKENALLVDVSPQADFDKGHIPTSRNVAMAQFDPEHKDLAKVKELPVAVVCRNGQTSSGAASRLVKAGFKKVYTLGGGVAAWTQADLPLAKRK